MEDTDFPINEFYLTPTRLEIWYDSNKKATIDLKSEQEVQIVATLLRDINFWAAFMNSLSLALGRVNEG